MRSWQLVRGHCSGHIHQTGRQVCAYYPNSNRVRLGPRHFQQCHHKTPCKGKYSGPTCRGSCRCLVDTVPSARTLHCAYKLILKRAAYAFASLACWTIYIGRALGVFFALAFLILTDRVTAELNFNFEAVFPIKPLLDRCTSLLKSLSRSPERRKYASNPWFMDN